MEDPNAFDPMTLTVADVRSVYSGKAWSCCCGCSGTHSYASLLREEAGKDRGYPVTDDDVNDREVRRVLKKGQQHRDMEPEYCAGSYFSVVVGKRSYIVYLSNACNERLSSQ